MFPPVVCPTILQEDFVLSIALPLSTGAGARRLACQRYAGQHHRMRLTPAHQSEPKDRRDQFSWIVEAVYGAERLEPITQLPSIRRRLTAIWL